MNRVESQVGQLSVRLTCKLNLTHGQEDLVEGSGAFPLPVMFE